MEIPTYKDSLKVHETPLEVFVSRWEPTDSKIWETNFREDLQRLVDWLLEQGRDAEEEYIVYPTD